eukprot:4626467-Prymnesium_polylepis.1
MAYAQNLRPMRLQLALLLLLDVCQALVLPPRAPQARAPSAQMMSILEDALPFDADERPDTSLFCLN